VTEPAGIHYRPATQADLAACEIAWRDGLNDYLVPLGQYEVPADNPSLRLMHEHTLATDPDRFWVATRAARDDGPEDPVPGADGELVIGFASAVRRASVAFLSMLFVQPSEQAGGVGRALLDRTWSGPAEQGILATVTDSAQPISNGLYAALGAPPRMPMLNLVGRPTRPEALAGLPDGIHAVRFTATAPAERDRVADAELAGLDRATLGFAHREDHEFVRRQGRVGFAYRDGRGELLGYGYASEIGRIGPIATRDPGLLAPIVAHLLDAVVPRGASAVWVPGAAGETVGMLVRAGLRMEGFPVLVCWSEPFADFGRYLPLSPGLL
jgi:GNAT superfamily N-acetyltransferase